MTISRYWFYPIGLIYSLGDGAVLKPMQAHRQENAMSATNSQPSMPATGSQLPMGDGGLSFRGMESRRTDSCAGDGLLPISGASADDRTGCFAISVSLGPMEDIDRQRTLAYFERLGKERVRLYTAIDCDRFLGDWQVRELADQWLDAKNAEDSPRQLGWPLLRRLLSDRRP